ncbi:MAG TPA: helix-hairpin-helix domain-containing protein [Victivallales bacterium]|nr:helix-hairpin-helix domain-containing protein [Victivallales bacterium]
MDITVAPDQLSLAIGKRGQNVRLTTKLLDWKVNIRSEAEDNTAFQEQLEGAIKTLSENINIGAESAKLLVNNGYLTVEGIKAAELSDITKIEGISEEDVAKIKTLKEQN